MSILPNIVDVALEHNLTVKTGTIGKKEVLCKCPFCLEDSNKPNKYYLSLNENKNVFKCWYCKKYGGVLKLLSFLTDQKESDIIESLRKQNGFSYKKHPAEKLSRNQLRMIGFPNINWVNNREFDVDLYKAFREHVYKEWLAFVDYQRLEAYQTIYTGILTNDYKGAIAKVEKLELELGVNLLADVLKEISNDKRTERASEREEFVHSILNKEHPFYTLQSSII
ncbi:hypothetical protein [Ornithinibacillus contaminans]|uniref:hypothetical protein n=1 Tax=Ornithinibacillus contaminans TaxID=694055 RepID=UPI00064E0182|nr:hypothetical protein [Ornithinibacillus contaminans]